MSVIKQIMLEILHKMNSSSTDKMILAPFQLNYLRMSGFL